MMFSPSSGLPHTTFHEDTVSDVKSAITNHVLANRNSCNGDFLSITWDSYFRLPGDLYRFDYQVVLDEVPQVDALLTFDLPTNYELMPELFDTEPVNSGISRVFLRDPDRTQKLLKEPRDDLGFLNHHDFKKLLEGLVLNHHEAFVSLEQWTRICEKKVRKSNPESYRLSFLTMLHPAWLNSALVLGANVKDSLFYHWFAKHHGYRFIEETAVSDHL